MRLPHFLSLLVYALGVSLTLLPAAAPAQVASHSVLLVASTQMKDPRFIRTVVLVTRHGRSPPVGVIINRPLETSLGTLFPNLPDKEAKRPLFFGGPVATNMVAFLFRHPVGSNDAIVISKNIHLGRSGATLSELLRGSRPHSGLRVFVGYAGWADGQLDDEIRRGGWHVMPVDQEAIFDKDIDLIWPDLIRRATQENARLPSSLLVDSTNT